jgi:hypothetical protein
MARRESVGPQPLLVAACKLARCAYEAEPSELSSDKREHEAVYCEFCVVLPAAIKKKTLCFAGCVRPSYSQVFRSLGLQVEAHLSMAKTR